MALVMNLKHPDGTEGLPPDAGGGAVGWSVWHWMRLLDAMQEEMGVDQKERLAPPDSYTFKQKHQFIAQETDVWGRGGEEGIEYIFTLHIGTEWICYRDR